MKWSAGLALGGADPAAASLCGKDRNSAEIIDAWTLVVAHEFIQGAIRPQSAAVKSAKPSSFGRRYSIERIRLRD